MSTVEIEGRVNQIHEVESILKNYFDSVLIIDDKMQFEEPLIEIETDLDLEIDEADSRVLDDLTVSADSVLDDKELEQDIQAPYRLLQDLIADGFVTFPYKFNATQPASQIEFLKNVLKKSKMLFLDWNLEEVKKESPTKEGTSALEILDFYSNSTDGLKCAVIYTGEEYQSVKKELEKKFDFPDEHGRFFQKREAENGNSLLGFIFEKKVDAKFIINEIAAVLLEDKSMVLHIMDSAERLEKTIANSIHRFNSPFEKVLLTQILSSEMTNEDIPSFLDSILISEVLSNQESLSVKENFLFFVRRNKILNVLKDKKVNSSSIEEFQLLVKVKGQIKDFYASPERQIELINLIESQDVYSFEQLALNVKEKYENFTNCINDILLFIILISDFLEDKELFKKNFMEQTVRFTKIMKYKQNSENKTETGSIYCRPEKIDKDEDKCRMQYLICITPFCDTFRPGKNINHLYKFIVGYPLEDVKQLTNTAPDNVAFTGIPNEEMKKMEFVKWEFHNVITLHVSEIEALSKVATLKKDYIQNIINRYISYQSRAGVDEMFYKDSFKKQFNEFLFLK